MIMLQLKIIGALATSAALSLTLIGCSSTPTVESNDGSSDSIEQEKESTTTTSNSANDSNSSSTSKPSSSSSPHKSYDDDDDGYSYSPSSSGGTSSDRNQTYAHTDPDGWSYMEYDDGSAEITDGWGMVARDTDGDGELDIISTDSGESWEDFE